MSDFGPLFGARGDLDDPARRLAGESLFEKLQRDIVDGNAAAGFTFVGAVMSMTVEYCGDRVAVDRLFETAASKERKNFRRLAHYRAGDRRIMEQRDA